MENTLAVNREGASKQPLIKHLVFAMKVLSQTSIAFW